MPHLYARHNSAGCWHNALTSHHIDLFIELMEYLHKMMAGLSQIFIFIDLKFSSMQQCNHLTSGIPELTWPEDRPVTPFKLMKYTWSFYFLGAASRKALISWSQDQGTVSLGAYLLTFTFICFSCPKLIVDVWICKHSFCKQDDESRKWGTERGMIKRVWSVMASWSFYTCPRLLNLCTSCYLKKMTPICWCHSC